MPDHSTLWDLTPWLHASFGVVSLVLVGSGAAKIADATGFVRFLSDSTRRSVPLAVGRAVGGCEAVLGLAALAVGGRVIAVMVALTYAAFAVVVAVAMRSGAPSCGCFGAASSRPRPAHLVMNVISMALAVVAALRDVPPVADLLGGLGIGAAAVVVAVMIAAVGAVVFVDTR